MLSFYILFMAPFILSGRLGYKYLQTTLILITLWALCDAALPNRAAARMLVASMASHPRLLIAQTYCNQHVLSSATDICLALPILFSSLRFLRTPKSTFSYCMRGAGTVNGPSGVLSRLALSSAPPMGYRHRYHLTWTRTAPVGCTHA